MWIYRPTPSRQEFVRLNARFVFAARPALLRGSVPIVVASWSSGLVARLARWQDIPLPTSAYSNPPGASAPNRALPSRTCLRSAPVVRRYPRPNAGLWVAPGSRSRAVSWRCAGRQAAIPALAPSQGALPDIAAVSDSIAAWMPGLGVARESSSAARTLAPR